MSVARGEFIAAMRTVAHSVAVVTTGGVAGRHGATVSSFCSASADPPSMLVSLRAASRIARLVTGNGAFCINVLGEQQRPLADRFAGADDAGTDDRFSGIALACEREPLPVLRAAATAFRCRVGDTFVAGSHLVVVGTVIEVRAGSARPLTYRDGTYYAAPAQLAGA